MTIGLKRSLLPRFLPISCSGEFQCCAGSLDMQVIPPGWWDGRWCDLKGTCILLWGAGCRVGLKLALGLGNDLYRERKSTAKWGQHRGVPGGTEGKVWPPLGEQLAGSRRGKSQRSEEEQGSAASSLLPGLSSQENNMKKRVTERLCTTACNLGAVMTAVN